MSRLTQHGLLRLLFRQVQVLSRQDLNALVERRLRHKRHSERLFRPKPEARFPERKTQLDRA